MRIQSTWRDGTYCTIRKNEFGEFHVRLTIDGVRFPGGDYFSDDRADAIGTANAMMERNR